MHSDHGGTPTMAARSNNGYAAATEDAAATRRDDGDAAVTENATAMETAARSDGDSDGAMFSQALRFPHQLSRTHVCIRCHHSCSTLRPGRGNAGVMTPKHHVDGLRRRGRKRTEASAGHDCVFVVVFVVVGFCAQESKCKKIGIRHGIFGAEFLGA